MALLWARFVQQIDPDTATADADFAGFYSFGTVNIGVDYVKPRLARRLGSRIISQKRID